MTVKWLLATVVVILIVVSGVLGYLYGVNSAAREP